MAHDIEKVKAAVKSFADEVRQVMPIAKVFLYGSYAKGTATKYSDIDVCFFVPDYDNQSWDEIMIKLLGISSKYQLGIEPNVFELSDLEDDDDYFVKEVLRTGIEIQ
jgi:predicted nucleotidyltransferase